MNKEIDIGNAQWQGSRDKQEDSFAFSNLSDKRFVSHGGILAVVADGMGGLEHGEDASSKAIEFFLNTYMAKKQGEDINDVLQRAINMANAEVESLARSKGMLGNIGSTIAAAVVNEQRLYWVSVGDSRIYLLRNGELCQINQEHTYLQELYKKVVRGDLIKEQAESDEQAGALTSYIGCLEQYDISYKPIRIQAGDIILLCTDGLYDTINETNMIYILQQDLSAHEIAEKLVDETKRANNPYQDNVTVLVMKIKSGIKQKDGRKRRFYIMPILLIVLILMVSYLLYINFSHLFFTKETKTLEKQVDIDKAKTN